MNFVPKKEWACKEEYVEFNKILERVATRRGKRKEKHIKELQIFFCDKVYEIMMRQKGYFTEVMKEKRALEIRLESVLNEKSYLEDENHDLRHKLATKGVFSHSPASLQENAS